MNYIKRKYFLKMKLSKTSYLHIMWVKVLS